MTIDLCNHFRYRTLSFKEFCNKKKDKVKDNNDFVPILLLNKNIDKIGINSILNKHKNLFPIGRLTKKYKDDEFKFSCCYRYQKPIRNKVLNYFEAVNNVEQDDVKCCCDEHLDYVDINCGHVLTGNLKIIDNRKIRNLVSKGTKFIEHMYYNNERIFKSINKDIEDYIDKLVIKHNVLRKSFDDWKNEVMKNIKDVVKAKNIHFSGKIRSILDSNNKFWEDFSRKFVLCPIDKAGNNVAIVCKKYYIDNIDGELNTTSTYNICNESEEDIVKRHVQFCKSMNIEVDGKDEKLPIIYMMPKFHKKPVGSRYIAASVSTSLKLLAKILSPILKDIQGKMKSKANYEFKFHDTSGFWIADNNFDMRKNLERLNNQKDARTINCFDFKTLYTNIPHNDLKERICNLIEEMFKLKEVEFVNFGSILGNIIWSKKRGGKYSFSCNNVKDMLNYLLDNIFVKFRGRIYKQDIGIPMGCDCAPFLANLYLFTYEYAYIKDLNVHKVESKKLFKFCSRYIDDLCIPNGPIDFLGLSKDIYPDCLILEKTNPVDTRVTFLDMDINIIGSKFDIKLYDKRTDFAFNVLSMPNMRSNVPETPTYGVFYSQLFRLCNVNSNISYFVKDVNQLMAKLTHQNFAKHKLLKYLARFINANHPCTFKYWEKLDMNMFTK